MDCNKRFDHWSGWSSQDGYVWHFLGHAHWSGRHGHAAVAWPAETVGWGLLGCPRKLVNCE